MAPVHRRLTCWIRRISPTHRPTQPSTSPAQFLPDFTDVNSSSSYTFSGRRQHHRRHPAQRWGRSKLTLATSNSYSGPDGRSPRRNTAGEWIGGQQFIGEHQAGGTFVLCSATGAGIQLDHRHPDQRRHARHQRLQPLDRADHRSRFRASNVGAIINSALSRPMQDDQRHPDPRRHLRRHRPLGYPWQLVPSSAPAATHLNLTKIGTNQVSFVGRDDRPGTGEHQHLSRRALAFQTSTSSMGDPTKTVTIGSGAILDFFNTSNVMNKASNSQRRDDLGREWNRNVNTFAGAITPSTASGTVDAGKLHRTGGASNANAVLSVSGNTVADLVVAIKNGPGLVTLLGSDSSMVENTTVNAGTLVLNQSFTTGAATTTAKWCVDEAPQSASPSNPLVFKTNLADDHRHRLVGFIQQRDDRRSRWRHAAGEHPQPSGGGQRKGPMDRPRHHKFPRRSGRRGFHQRSQDRAGLRRCVEHHGWFDPRTNDSIRPRSSFVTPWPATPISTRRLTHPTSPRWLPTSISRAKTGSRGISITTEK